MFQQDMRRVGLTCFLTGIALGVAGLIGFANGLNGNSWLPEGLAAVFLWLGMAAVLLVPAGLILLAKAPSRPAAA